MTSGQKHTLDLRISVSDVSLEANPKPHIVYHVAIKLPVQSYTLKKRYSDFTELHSQLTLITGESPPEILPPKHYFTSTLSRPDLVEERRTGLEAYLQAINNHINSKWRDSPPWRTFLNLPIHRSTRTGAMSSALPHSGAWIERYNGLKSDLQLARLQLAKRSASSDTAECFKAASAANKSLMQARRIIEELGVALDKDDTIGDGEARRRTDLLTQVVTESNNLQNIARSLTVAGRRDNNMQSVSNIPQRDELLDRGANVNRRILGKPRETERTRGVDNGGLLQLQDTMMREQDSQLDEFSNILSRQKELGYQIGAELDQHNQILNRLEEDVDRTTGKIKLADKRAAKFK